MRTPTTVGRTLTLRSLQLTALYCVGAVLVSAHADPAMSAAPSVTSPSLSDPFEATAADEPAPAANPPGAGVSSAGDAADRYAPRGNEMPALAGVELERTDRRFRSRVVDWARERSVAAGLATDFLLHGSDTGVHLHVSGAQYLVRWEKRF